MKLKSLSRVGLLPTPWTVAYEAPLSMGFSRQDYWSGVPLPSPDKTLEPHKCDRNDVSGYNWRWKVRVGGRESL